MNLLGSWSLNFIAKHKINDRRRFDVNQNVSTFVDNYMNYLISTVPGG